MSGCVGEARATALEASAPPLVVEHGTQLSIPERSPLRERLTLATVAFQPVRRELELPATAEVDPSRLARIVPPLQGRVVRLLVHLGEEVKAGQPLCTFDSADLAAAGADYLRASSAAQQAARALTRQRDLSAHGIGAERELEQAVTDDAQARSELERATTRLRLLGLEPSAIGQPLVLRAPLGGRVIELTTSPGQYQNDPAAALMVIADLTSLWVTAQLPEKDLQRVQLNDEVQVRFGAYPTERLRGTVQLIGDLLAPETRTVKVRIALANPAYRFKPGMFARVEVAGPPRQALLVPPSALRVHGDDSALYVEKSPWTLERRAVEVGDSLAQGVEITSGLEPGERVVTANTILLP